MTRSRRLSIILASYNDARIEESIRSIRRFDDIEAVRLVVVDGGSSRDIVGVIRPLLEHGDVLISEPDSGIFDALNKGLALCTTEFVGWLGSDDIFTGRVLASDVVRALETNDLFVASLAVFRGARIRRLTHSLPCRFGLARFGLHNPHYSTFGRLSLLRTERFDLGLLGSDIEYFLRIFARRPRVATTSRVAVLMREGGFSSSSYGKILSVNRQLFQVYARHSSWPTAVFALVVKAAYKCMSAGYYLVRNEACSKYEARTLPASSDASRTR